MFTTLSANYNLILMHSTQPLPFFIWNLMKFLLHPFLLITMGIAVLTGYVKLFIDVLLSLVLSVIVAGCVKLFIDVLLSLVLSVIVAGCVKLFIDVLLSLVLSVIVAGCVKLFIDVLLSLVLSVIVAGCVMLFFDLFVAKRDVALTKSHRSSIHTKDDYGRYEVSLTHLGTMKRGEITLLMMVLMTPLFFSGAQACSSLPLACASQPPPPPPAACAPPPPIDCPPPPSVFAAPPPPPSVFAAPPPPPSVFAAPSPPPPATNEGFWHALLNVIRGWNRPMTIIIPVVSLLGGLGCCGRRYCRGRGHLQDVEDVASAISDL